VSQDSEENGLEQFAVRCPKHASLSMPFHQGFRVVLAFGPGAQCGDCGLTDVKILGWHEGVGGKLKEASYSSS